jgi:hypothetical protein
MTATDPKRRWRNKVNNAKNLVRAKDVGTGLAFIIFPLVFVLAFAGHPGLLSPHFLGPEELIVRARGDAFLQFGHALVTLNTGLLVVVSIHFMGVLDRTSYPWAGLLGAILAVLGALMLAADKGALCLTMSALDELSDEEFARMMPGLLVMFAKGGWLVLLWGILLLAIGVAIQAVGLLRSNAIPRWQGTLLLIGVLFVATPDGVEIVNLTASVLLTVAFVPYGIGIISKGTETNSRLSV